MKYQDIITQIDNKVFQPVYFLMGEETYYIDKISDYIVKIPADDTPRIQEHHILFGHIICELVEKSFL